MKVIPGAVFLILGGFVSLLVSCSSSQSPNVSPVVPAVQGPGIDAGSIPSGQGRRVTLSNGAEIYLRSRGGVPYFEVEGTFTKESFARVFSHISAKPESERRAMVSQEIDRIFSKISSIRGVGLYQVPEVGYFTFEVPYTQDLMASLKTLGFSHSLIFNPIVFDPFSIQALRDLNPIHEGWFQKAGSRESSRGWSGLERIRAVEFVKQAELDIGEGVKVDGSLVRVGVADTGVTLSHPSFRSNLSGVSRISYLKDFTREGRVYFNKNAKFEIKIPSEGTEEDLLVHAQVILTPVLPNLPEGDVFTDITELKIKVSPQLRAILTQPGSGAKLGVLSESAFQSESDPVDINGNGSLNDQLYVILIPGATPEEDVIYVDPTGTADFRNSTPVGDWNKTRATVPAFAEQLGFSFSQDTLPSKNGGEGIEVRSVSLVGFDPGNHGTHVSGIIAANRMIGNDTPSTLARGVAPESTLLVNRVCSNNGGCNATLALVDLAINAHAEVINMSLGGLNPFNDGYGVQETLINRTTSLFNILYVISAGNSGPGRQTVGSPSTARMSLSVGASATREMIQRQYQWPANSSKKDEDFMLFFSSRGPTSAGGFKPNVVAPGTELSSIALNSAPGSRGGLDIYWGTSMAAPTVTGAYALFLDAIKKYNLKNPSTPLPSNSALLKEVIMQSARPFDISRFEPASGEKLAGQYTWIDEGMGMVDLLAAWKKLLEYRDRSIPSAVQLAGKPMDLDYQVLVSMTSPQGIAYDGSAEGTPGVPAFGTGVYLDYFGGETLRQVGITRSLPEVLGSAARAGALMAQLRTTKDEFVLKTYIYGSDRPWLKTGTLDQLSCLDSGVSNLTVIGEGALVNAQTGGGAKLNPFFSSTLNLCIDRQMIASELEPGDHGALILGYRVADGRVNPLASFTVPVYLTVPHQTLSNSTAYDVEKTVSSFGVSRNYVTIPKGTTFVKVTLEVPQLKTDSNSQKVSGQSCSGVELMPLLGLNINKAFKTRQEARISNCDAQGKVQNEDSKRKLVFAVDHPVAGIWDLPVFGSYKYFQSKFKLRVDYVTVNTSVNEIQGGLEALNGSLKLTLKEASFQVKPDPAKSSYMLTGLEADTPSEVKNGESVYVPGLAPSVSALSVPTVFRTYSKEVKKVMVKTSASPGNDIDLDILECPSEVQQPTDPLCTELDQSNGPGDSESVSFEPKLDKVYAVRVRGTKVINEGKFMTTETVMLAPEFGDLLLEGPGGLDGVFDVVYAVKAQQLASSRLLNHDLFKTSKVRIVGSIELKSAEGTLLGALPVTITHFEH